MYLLFVLRDFQWFHLFVCLSHWKYIPNSTIDQFYFAGRQNFAQLRKRKDVTKYILLCGMIILEELDSPSTRAIHMLGILSIFWVLRTRKLVEILFLVNFKLSMFSMFFGGIFTWKQCFKLIFKAGWHPNNGGLHEGVRHARVLLTTFPLHIT